MIATSGSSRPCDVPLRAPPLRPFRRGSEHPRGPRGTRSASLVSGEGSSVPRARGAARTERARARQGAEEGSSRAAAARVRPATGGDLGRRGPPTRRRARRTRRTTGRARPNGCGASSRASANRALHPACLRSPGGQSCLAENCRTAGGDAPDERGPDVRPCPGEPSRASRGRRDSAGARHAARAQEGECASDRLKI